jgi:hypothetical protein
MRSGINNVMMASLSLQLAQWNWNRGADTPDLMGDGKTLATSTVVSHHVDLEQPLLIVIRDVDLTKCGIPRSFGWVDVHLIFLTEKRDSWLIGSLTGAVVFNIVAKYIQIDQTNYYDLNIQSISNIYYLIEM